MNVFYNSNDLNSRLLFLIKIAFFFKHFCLSRIQNFIKPLEKKREWSSLKLRNKYRKTIVFILFLFFPCFSMSNEDNLTSISLQTEALAEAHDYLAASQMYEKLLDLSLPDWQKERLFYNLGTIRLAQQNPVEALSFFQKINPVNLSLVHFGSNFFINKGIAYLQYAQSLAVNNSSSLNQQITFIEQSLNAFDQAQQLDCQIQKKESSSICDSSFLLNQWISTTRLQLNEVLQNKRQKWMENASLEMLASLIDQNMQQWMNFIKKYQEFSISMFPYFQYQAESLISIWKAIQQKKLSIDQKETFEKSMAFYTNAVEKLSKKDHSSAIKEWEQSIEFIKPLVFQKNQEIRYVQLNYLILLLQNNLTVSSLQDLIEQFENLKIEKEQSPSIKQIQSFLKISLQALQAKQLEQAHFFLIAGYSKLNSIFNEQNSTPAVILQQALDQANRTLELSFLAEAISGDNTAQIYTILKSQQTSILTQIAPFIPTVLKEQYERFHQDQDANAHCQQTPWDQVIPLYDKGFRLAQNVEKQHQQTVLDFQTLIAAQIQTIKEWEQALDLILHPPQQGSGASTSQKWTNTFRQLQEMYLEDQSKPEQATKELHSW